MAVLTDSKDELAYWRKLKQREPQLVTICHGLKMPAKDGKLRYADCVNTKNAFRIIQSIPSPKAEPFKQWLAEVGYERIQEIENPELAQDRAKDYYEFKGYPVDWIEKRLRGIAIRQDLTDEWKIRGIQEQKDFAILTNEISKATTDITISKDSHGFNECNKSAIDGGTIAKNTRKEIEEKTGNSIVSDENYLHLTEKKINKQIKD
ncbi:MAG: hypothetical protein M8350_00945 [Methanosarcinaceae archaeon]|nr:hypothetical protein [Methanosarcinaceae archaeon]